MFEQEAGMLTELVNQAVITSQEPGTPVTSNTSDTTGS